MGVQRCLALLLLATAPAAGTAPPELDSRLPALRIGHVQEVSFSGKNLPQAGTVWSSVPLAALPREEEESSAGPRAEFTLFVPDQVRPGIAAVRLAGENGISPVRLLLVDGLPLLSAGTGRHETNRAMALSPPVAVQARCREASLDYYRVELSAGVPVAIETVAARLGSSMDSVLRVLDGAGNELAFNDDAPERGRDSKVVFVAPECGPYFIEVRDVYYQGGSTTFYVLRVQERGLAPLSFIEENLPVWFKHARREPAEGPVVSPPGDSLSTAPSVPIPSVLAGAFSRTKQRDFFRFNLEQEERLVFAGATRRLGFPCDLHLGLLDADGRRVAESSVGPGDTRLDHRFRRPGTYFLQVEELAGLAGADWRYQIEVGPFEPGFDLEIDSDTFNVRAGEEIEVRLTLTRREYDGPVELDWMAPGDGILNLSQTRIGEKEQEGAVRLRVAEDAPPGWRAFALAGKAAIDGREQVRLARTSSAIRSTYPQWLHPPQALNGLLLAGILPPESSAPVEGEADE